MPLNYDGRTFRSISNTGTGEVDASTLFEYHQEGEIVWATYSGGAIQFGTLIAIADTEGNLDMRYSHVNRNGLLATGICTSKPELLPDGRLRLYESWRWTSGDFTKGNSIIEEIPGI